ncbi:MAG: hypothetical protein ACR2HD_05440 [Solirubrobacteraceae bacterium]|nr:MAG: hypothetical protein DLM63_00110 [Solirubrobacterales bacterium]
MAPHPDPPVPGAERAGPDASSDDIWQAGRIAAREQVRGAFAPRTRRCESCGAEESSSTRFCPHCGVAYAERRRRGLSRRARAIALGLTLVAAVAAVLVSGVLAPSLQRADRVQGQREARQLAALYAADYRRRVAEQAPRFARGPRAFTHPVTGALRSRGRLLAFAEAAITADARRRVAAGLLAGPAISTSCEPYPPTSQRGAAEANPAALDLVYDCLAAETPVRAASGVVGTIGYPFLLRLHYDSGRMAWCKTNPVPGERGVQALEGQAPLSRACGG